MKTSLSGLQLLAPRSLDEALHLLSAHPEVRPMAGCTDLYVGLNAGTAAVGGLLDLWPLDELRGIQELDGWLRIGALTTHAELGRSDAVRRHVPILAEASREIGGAQIQNRGTLAGNVANASPAGDTLPVLAVTEAVVVARSVEGERRIPFDRFYTGYRATVLRPEELIVAIEIPPLAGRPWYRKVGTRAAQAISKVVMAAVRAPVPRIALGSVAATVVRLPATEACLAGGGEIEEAQRVLAEEIRPIDDVRSTAAYRTRVACNLLAQWWKVGGD